MAERSVLAGTSGLEPVRREIDPELVRGRNV
jgi:hypothetical protein